VSKEKQRYRWLKRYTSFYQTDHIYEIRDGVRDGIRDKSYSYHHYPHKPALLTLQQYINNAKKLHWIHDPDTNTWLRSPSDIDWENAGRYNALKQLYLECGWPERFEREEFMQRYLVLGRSRGWDD
jgi:hypothetical protein